LVVNIKRYYPSAPTEIAATGSINLWLPSRSRRGSPLCLRAIKTFVAEEEMHDNVGIGQPIRDSLAIPKCDCCRSARTRHTASGGAQKDLAQPDGHCDGRVHLGTAGAGS
jgi:hypothetical protein